MGSEVSARGVVRVRRRLRIEVGGKELGIASGEEPIAGEGSEGEARKYGFEIPILDPSIFVREGIRFRGLEKGFRVPMGYVATPLILLPRFLKPSRVSRGSMAGGTSIPLPIDPRSITRVVIPVFFSRSRPRMLDLVKAIPGLETYRSIDWKVPLVEHIRAGASRVRPRFRGFSGRVYDEAVERASAELLRDGYISSIDIGDGEEYLSDIVSRIDGIPHLRISISSMDLRLHIILAKRFSEGVLSSI